MARSPQQLHSWSTIKQLNRQHENHSINFNSKPYIKPKKIANCLNCHYTPSCSTKPSKEYRKTLRNMKKINKVDALINITMSMTKAAIKKTKNSKTLGPDHKYSIMIKHLGPSA